MRVVHRFAVIAMLLGVAVVAGNVLVAQSGRGSDAQAQAGPGQRVPDAMFRRAVMQGRLRVIVGLNVPTVPEGLLDAAQRANQRARIAQAQSAVLTDLAAFNFGLVKRFTVVAGMALDADLAGLDVLAAHPLVAYLEEDRLARPTLAQSAGIVGATTVWSGGVTGLGRAVAILDTGVDRFHSFMGGRVVSEACYSSTVGGQFPSTSVCPGGAESAIGPGTGAPCPFSAPLSDDCAHGTHVAGIAAGSGGSFNGMAPGADIIAVQVFSRFDDPGFCGGANFTPCAASWSSDQILGLQRVYELRDTLNPVAANMSLGGGFYSSQSACDSDNATEKAIIDTLRSVGIATVIASGNDGFTTGLSAPGCISSAISVGSTTDGSNGAPAVDQISYFSNSAPFLNLLAPGHFITSSIPGGGFAIFAGTSMAAPHVAGAWALLKSVFPSASVTQVLTALANTGTGILDTRNGITKPRINISSALAAMSAPPPADGFLLPDRGRTTFPDTPTGFGLDEAISTINGAAFEPRDSSTSFTTDIALGRWVTGGAAFLYTPLPELPNGANITQVLFYIEDSDGASDFTGRLCRHWTDAGTGLNPGTDCPVNITSVGTPGSTLIYTDFLPALIRRFDVDNDGTLEDVSYTLSGGWGSSTTGTIKLRQARLLWRRQVSPAPASATFSDVPLGSPIHPFVEALAASGITGGCGGGMYCPNSAVTRGQMAVFLSAALGLHWPAF